MELNPEHEAILISANEDYLTLRDAALEMVAFVPRDEAQGHAVQPISDLIENGYIYMVQLQEGAALRKEIRHLSNPDALGILIDPGNWQHWNLNDNPYYALSPTDLGRAAFVDLLQKRSNRL